MPGGREGAGSRIPDPGSRLPLYPLLRYTCAAPCISGVTTAEIPNRSLFRQPEVCEIAQVQPYVLRTWEAEFPDLGVAKTAGGPRVYRRADLEFVLRIKHLLFVDGLTLAGARRKLLEEHPAADTVSEGLDELLGSDARERILLVKRGLKEIAVMLGKTPSSENVAAARNLFDLADSQTSAQKRAKKVAVPAKKKK
jgi:DNA-binding transcriptional MerR regulator